MKNSRAIFFIILLLAQYSAYCQKDMDKQRHETPKYRFVEPKLFLYDTVRFRKITENVYYTIEHATMSRKKIVAVQGYENEQMAFFSSMLFSTLFLVDSFVVKPININLFIWNAVTIQVLMSEYVACLIIVLFYIILIIYHLWKTNVFQHVNG